MNKFALILLVLLLPFGIDNATAGESATENKNAPALTPLTPEGTLQWLSWDDAVKLNEKSPGKIFIDFYTEWCGWCKVMDNKTFSDPYIAQYMSRNFYCVKFDAERKDSIRFMNYTFKWVPGGRNGFHQLAAYFMQNEMSYPTFTVLTAQYELISPIKGFIPKEQFEPMLSFFAQDLWKTQSDIEAFKASYKRPE